MAEAFGHKFGQIIGDALECSIAPCLKVFARKNHLFLDSNGPRPARKGNKVSWTDINGNKHDLDYVMERGGTTTKTGAPVAFIECAWRRYTKHSRNKAQEIQGAIIPLFEKYKKEHPFIGVVLAGEFTQGSLSQLESLGFCILHFPYQSIIKSFAVVGIDAQFDEHTGEKHFERQVRKWETLSTPQKRKVYKQIAKIGRSDLNRFISSLTKSIKRRITKIRVWTIYGEKHEFNSIAQVKTFLSTFQPQPASSQFDRFEAEIEYSNGDVIKAAHKDKNEFLVFLSYFI